MAAYTISEEAERDLKSIWRYIANRDSTTRADKLLDRLEAKIKKIATSPIGTKRDDLKAGLLTSLLKPYLIFYTMEDPQHVTIRRVIHGKRDIESIFENE